MQLVIISTVFILIQSYNGLEMRTPVPNNYTQQTPSVQLQDQKIWRSISCPNEDCFVYQYQTQKNCFYWRRILARVNIIKFCYQNKTDYTTAIAFSPKGDLFIVGTTNKIYVWQCINSVINISGIKYNYTLNSFNGLISISKSNKIAASAVSSIVIMILPQTGSELILQSSHDFKNGTQHGTDYAYPLSLQWHTIDTHILFVGTNGRTKDQGGFWLYNSVQKAVKLINSKTTYSIEVFNDGNVVLQSGCIDDKGNLTNCSIDAFIYNQAMLTFNNQFASKVFPNKMQLSTDNRRIFYLSQSYLYVYNVLFNVSQSDHGDDEKYMKIKNKKYAQKDSTNDSDQINDIKLIQIQLQTVQVTQGIQILVKQGYSALYSSDGNQILFLQENNSSQFLRFDLCKDGSFYDNQGCYTCADQCPMCFKENYICRTCNGDRYWKDNSCIKCAQKLDGCLLCQNQTSCIRCDDVNGFLPDPVNGVCECLQNYTLYNHQCVIKCNVIGCLNCSSSPDNCSTCDSDKGFNPAPFNKCACSRDRFLNQSTKQCLFCNSTLVGCSKCNMSTSCIQCNQDKGFLPDPLKNGSCVCPDYRYFDSTNKICVNCSSIQIGCILCVQNGRGGMCNGCGANYTINYTAHKCDCIKGMVNVSNSCKQCSTVISSCLNCTLNDSTLKPYCLVCGNNFNVSFDKQKCECLYPFEVSQNSLCIQKPQDNNGSPSIGLIIGGIVGVIVLGSIGGVYWYKKKKNHINKDQNRMSLINQEQDKPQQIINKNIKIEQKYIQNKRISIDQFLSDEQKAKRGLL